MLSNISLCAAFKCQVYRLYISLLRLDISLMSILDSVSWTKKFESKEPRLSFVNFCYGLDGLVRYNGGTYNQKFEEKNNPANRHTHYMHRDWPYIKWGHDKWQWRDQAWCQGLDRDRGIEVEISTTWTWHVNIFS